ncbi:MAG: hypothetical protein ACUVSB_00475 [Anaerolineae bacterium]
MSEVSVSNRSVVAQFAPGAAYRQRWNFERCFGWVDNCRRLVVRYERHLHLYKAFCLVTIILWCIERILKRVLTNLWLS